MIQVRPLVLAADNWKRNADLIVACRDLGYLPGHVLDPTYGKGNWWKKWRPEKFTTSADFGPAFDYRNMPFHDDFYDAVAFDPPYVSPGGRDTSTTKGMHKAFGMDETPKSVLGLFLFNREGMRECVRVLRPGGFLCYKSKDYITSGRYWPITTWIGRDAEDLFGLEAVDRLEMIGKPGPQSQKTQVHARRNLSTMLVFRKP